jgi:hypothetical protein
MKLTRDYLRKLIIESLIEGNVISGDFGKSQGVDLGKPASVTDISSKMKEPEDEMPKGAMWVKDVAALVDAILDYDNLNKLGEADEALANKLHQLATDVLPFVREHIPSSRKLPADAYTDDTERSPSTDRTYEISGMEPEDKS